MVKTNNNNKKTQQHSCIKATTTVFPDEERALIWRSKVSHHSSVHLGPSRTPPPHTHTHSQRPWMNTCTHKPPPLPPHSISSSFPASPFLISWGLLKGPWLHFQFGSNSGVLPPGRLAGNEGSAHCARCFSALRFCRWKRKLSFPRHTPHTGCVCLFTGSD